MLVLGSHFVCRGVFGTLRASEQESVRDHLWNLILYKVIFLFGVVDVEGIQDAVIWAFFISLVGFSHIARQLSKERHHYVSTCHSIQNLKNLFMRSEKLHGTIA